jgi:aminomethyltransferase
MTGDAGSLERTPLFDLHVTLGAKMVPFAGYEMPVQYPLGVLKEHLHTRAAAGLFDVSHMGQIELRGAGCDAALETLTCANVIDLAEGKQRYALFTDDAGGILDDFMVTRYSTHLMLVVNAGCKGADLAHLRKHLASQCEVLNRPDLALLALQGPKAEEVLGRLAPEVLQLSFMQACEANIAGVLTRVSRSGYTGEDGFEISVGHLDAAHLAGILLAQENVQPIGLGARDSLRLEAGLCLHGHDIDDSTNLLEAALEWSVGRARRPGGARAGGYPGAEIVEAQLSSGAPRRRVGLKPVGRRPVREGAAIQTVDGVPVGQVTSGGFGPSIGGPIAMGYVQSNALDGELVAVVRNSPQPVEVTPLPFIPNRYRR